MKTAVIKFFALLAALTWPVSNSLFAVDEVAGFQRLTGAGDSLAWDSASKFTSIPFEESSAFSGNADSATGNVLTVLGGFWKVDQFVYDVASQRRSYYVEVVTGTIAGNRFDIIGNSGNTLMVDLNGGSLSGIASGDEVRICSKWTLDLLFPGGAYLTASTAATTGTEILLPAGIPGDVDFASAPSFQYRSDLSRWINVNAPGDDAGDTVILRGAAVVIKQSSASPIQPVIAGVASVGGVPLYMTVSYGLPEITVEQPVSTNLVDGSAVVDFGAVAESSSSQLDFTIRNSGTFPLIGLAAVVSGNNASDFTLGALGASALNPGQMTSFSVQFQPGAMGDRSTGLEIASNDPDNSPFDIALIGSTSSSVTLESWAGSFGLSGAALLSTADDDGDGVSLIMEYAFNLDPTINDWQVLAPETGTSGLPHISVDGDRLRIEFVRRIAGPGMTIEPQFSGTLDPADFSSASVTIENIDINFERVVAIDTVTVANAPRRFGRVLVTELP